MINATLNRGWRLSYRTTTVTTTQQLVLFLHRLPKCHQHLLRETWAELDKIPYYPKAWS